MSDALQIVGGIVGAGIGFFLGGPTGAALGYSLGSAGTAALTADEQSIEGPRKEDLSVQSSAFGRPLPGLYGTKRFAGNLIWLETGEIQERSSTQEVGGKGGGTERTTYSYFATFAVSFCGGPIAGVRKIWADSVLIYDGSTETNVNRLLGGANVAGESVAEGDNEFGRIVIYRGTEDQQRHPRIEADPEIEGTPAYRGTAYLVIEDMALEKYGNRIPSISAEIVGPPQTPPRPALIATHDLPLPNVSGEELVDTADHMFFRNDQLFINLDPDDPRPAEGDGDNAYDYIYSPDIEYLGRRKAPHLDMTRFEELPDEYIEDKNYNPAAAEAGYFLGVFPFEETTCSVHASGKGARVYFVEGGDVRREIVPLDSGKVTARISEGEGSLFVFYSEPGVPIHYERYAAFESSLYAADDAGEMEWPGEAVFGSAISVESDFQRIWLATQTLSYVTLYEREQDGSYAIVGTSPGSGGWNEAGTVSENGLCWLIYRDTVDIFTAQPLRDRVGLTLGAVVADIAQRAGMASSDIDVSTLTDEVRGYLDSRIGSAASKLEPLRTVFPFDAAQNGYRLSFIRRGGNPVAALTDGDLAGREPGQATPPVVTVSRALETSLPRRVRVQYQDPATDYEVGSQYAARHVTEAQGKRQIDTPVVLTSDDAARLADTTLRRAWTEQTTLQAIATVQRAALTVGDVVDLQTDAYTGTARIVRIDDGRPGLRQLDLLPDSVAIYTSEAEGQAGIAPPQQLEPVGATDFVLLDVPPLRDRHNTAGYYAAIYGLLPGWQGGVIQRLGQGVQWRDVQFSAERATVGFTIGLLADGPSTVWDRGNSLTVDLNTGELASISEADALEGTNTLAVRAGEEWEIIQAATVTLEADGTYTLSDLLRGRFGTEHVTGEHADNDQVVLLDGPGISFIEANQGTIGFEATYRGQSLNGTAQPSRAFRYRGRNLRPYSPAHLRAAVQLSGDIEVTWIRRARAGGEWKDYSGVPLVEPDELYVVRVLENEGDDSIRSAFVESPAWTYAAADQAADGITSGQQVIISVAQFGGAVGPGVYRSTTVAAA